MNTLKLLITAFALGTAMVSNAQSYETDTEITVTGKNGKQEVIDIPEAMTTEVDSLLHLYNTQRYLKPSADCNQPDINPFYEKEVYKARLQRMPTIIEMPYNDVVQKFIDRYANNLRRSVSIMLGATNFYMPIFEEALEAYNLPLELKYLPVIESGLNPQATSYVGAAGLWQFMIGTGKRYGLEINSLVDERRDLIKSSYAAANYLSDLYRIFRDWHLVIAAYNCGPDKINKAIHRAGGTKDYWQIYPYLPKETRGYVPAFIAANYIMNYYCDHNICPMVADIPAKTDTVMVNRDIHFNQIASVLNMEVSQLKELNPQYRRNIINGSNKPSSLRLPSTLVNKFIDNEQAIYDYNADALLNKRAEVEVNEENIANTSYSRSNSYTRSSNNNSYRSSRHKNKHTKKHKERSQNVTIKDGDTLSEIAERNHTTVSKLKKLNKISGSNIRAGKKLRVK
jgi:membrane-bound lytic murein transglycosylase D